MSDPGTRDGTKQAGGAMRPSSVALSSIRRSIILAALAALALATVAVAASDTLVTVGSPTSPFAQNKQNEPAVAVDAHNTQVLAAGSNDEIDLEACAAGAPTTCPFTAGVGVSGIYFSFNGGASWTQPTYTGFTARDCLGPAACVPHVGPIGTLPKYYENGLVSDGDPALAFGPRRGTNGTFAWANGSRLYYANLVSNFPGRAAFSGAEAVMVSRTDDPAAAAAGNANAWRDPVLVSRQSSATFSDKEQIWADNAASSPFFGNVYICNVAFRSNGRGGAPEPVMVATSRNGGDSWTQHQISAATNTNQTGGRQGCSVRTDSLGTVYVFWVGTDIKTRGTVFFMARSFNGGATWEQSPKIAMRVTDVGQFDPTTGRFSFDGVGGARTSTFPTVDITNGAPSGAGATDEIVLAGPDGPTPTTSNPGPNERAAVRYSLNQGTTWHDAGSGSPPGDRPDFPAIAISPAGTDVYLVYDNFLQPWQTTTANPRWMQGVVRHADVAGNGSIGAWADLSRGPTGDARGSSQNGLTAEFLGDYNYAVATDTFGNAVWNDVRNATDCPAIDAFRQSIVDGSPTAPPAPGTDCPATFGNSDIYGASYADPTP
ncbi:MAG: glycoside hydrolase [Actinomycetota bacterium]|nr:glycoside hydrolase [Actinomycetota bacterium]